MQIGNLILFIAMMALVVTATVLGRREFLRIAGGESPEARRIRVRYGIGLWLFWLVCVSCVMAGVDAGWLTGPLAVYGGVGLVAAVGFALIWVWYRWLKASDEFHQKFETGVLALSFGLTLIGIIAAQQLNHAAIIPPLDLWGTLQIGIFAWVISRWLVFLKYR